MTMTIDDTDKAILNLLQDDCTLPLKTIAEHTGTSVATTQRRISQLCQQKIIQRQVAIIDPTKVGHHLTVLVLVKMAHSNTSMQHRFERLMNGSPQVMSCYEISGDYDFILMVHSPSMQDYHAFTRSMLTGENNVAHFNSQFVMNFVKSGTKIEL
ncbi:Lrp/AsnC family transcriptional regulator [Moraxella sp. VT-16-12]|nr:Lrp/AsnC family transcriptional regulator [Moraxella sp. VT-16-12]